MQLIRLVIISFNSLSESWTKWTTEVDDLKVSTVGYSKEKNSSLLLVKCEVDVTGILRLNDQNEILIPENLVSRMNTAIESAANLFSVLEQTKRSISSPMPCVAFVPADEIELHWLNSTKGIKLCGSDIIGVKFKLNLELQSNLWDRSDGVALLAEALANDHPTGAFHEFIRFFERAFTLSSSKLVSPLSEFLNGTQQGYTVEEVENWLVHLRHPATHADRRNDFITEQSLRPVLRRMNQAAYDILFNKLDWRSSATTRRNTWKPDGGTGKPKGSLVFLAGREPVTFEATVMDDLGSYPVNLSIGIKNFIGKDWWTRRSDLKIAEAKAAKGV